MAPTAKRPAPPLPLRAQTLKYWARAQSAAYLMRLNAPTLAAINAMRRAPGILGDPSVPLPLPRGSVALHMRQVRRGAAASRRLCAASSPPPIPERRGTRRRT